jgi:hypothetical protein
VLGKNLPNTGNVTEEDPVWLKSKGDDFFRIGDHLSAINAYSAAIDADEDICVTAKVIGYNVGCFAQWLRLCVMLFM